jgi:ketosteroid isomerase-like protein
MGLNEEIAANNERFCAAIATRDLRTLADCFDPGATMMIPGSPAFEGAEACAAYFGAGPAVSGAVMTATKVEPSGDAVIEAGTYTMTVTLEGDDPIEDHGSYLAVHRRGTDGTLRLWFDTYHSDAAVEA